MKKPPTAIGGDFVRSTFSGKLTLPASYLYLHYITNHKIFNIFLGTQSPTDYQTFKNTNAIGSCSH